MSDDTGETGPWTEAQWEKMMRESDLKSARFGELLETLIDHPERDKIVAREMGWTELADMMEQNPHAGNELCECDEADFESEDEPASSAGFSFRDEHDREMQQIPAYVACERAAHAIDDVLEPYQRRESAIDETTGE